MIAAHAPGLNGPAYWQWPWRQLPWVPLVPMFAAAVLPFLAAQECARRQPERMALAVGLLMASAALSQWASVAVQAPPFGGDWVVALIRSPDATSYYVDAAKLHASGLTAQPHWLRYFALLQPHLAIHSTNKPPAAIAYYLGFIRLFGDTRRAALWAGAGIAILSTGTIAAVYATARALLNDAQAAFCAASVTALSPAFVLFFPEFDPFYGVFTCACILAWHRALTRPGVRWTLLFALAFSAALFVSYSLALLGPFFALQTLVLARSSEAWRRAVWKILAAICGVCLVYAALQRLTGFSLAESLRAAIAVTQAQKAALGRIYPRTIPYDLLDFALGTGWVGALLALFYLPSCRLTRDRYLPALGLLQLLVVALSGRLPGETARVWLFMLPLIAVPAGLELARWPWRWRIGAYGALFVMTLVIARNMTWIVP